MEPKKAIVIDDSSGCSHYVAKALQEKGYEVEEYISADEALAALGFLNENEIPRSADDESCLRVTDWSGRGNPAAFPDLIVTDNDTDSFYSGVHVLKAMQGKGTALVMMSGGSGQSTLNIQHHYAAEAQFVKKTDGRPRRDELFAAIDAAQIAAGEIKTKQGQQVAIFEKLNLQQKEGGRGVPT